ncbi:SHOCT domain-containing protein [Solirubrobacter ginsenosidimutans]|uniref:SHOCT domain-containing protein n=1 Tax=Solirubrobacter ginsenosidimutans TaxID=490573 RepID=A0A9X3N0Y2_9ACTN|nr:SHOCT domain-containing protein [Solirubrobacter ginsenosidimutans]MDA0165033.1 SHOCT domain-containing protein [Solirubrobacter ginsenosidimutans]
MGRLGDWLRGRRTKETAPATAVEAQTNGHSASDELVEHLRAAFPGAEITVSSHDPKLSDLTGGDPVERLERLAALHASGALTDEEFAAAKARLLG